MASKLRVDHIEPVGGIPTGGGGGIIQLVSTIKTDTVSLSMATTTESGVYMATSITPRSASNKILIQVWMNMGFSNNGTVGMILTKGGSTLTAPTGAASSNRKRVSAANHTTNTARDFQIFYTYLDSPLTTSATTYGVKFSHAENGTETLYINRNATDSDSNLTQKPASTLTLMEVSG